VPLPVAPLPELPVPEPPRAGAKGMVPPLQPIRKTMANNKTLILSIKFPLMNRDRDRRLSPLLARWTAGA
jgi:hypothetical protein